MTSEQMNQPIEKKVHFALKQLWQLEQLRELNGPKSMEESLIRQLKDSHAALGDELWEQVHKLYPSFREEQLEKKAADTAWEAKCASCVHWTGDEMSEKWCQKYKRAEIAKPRPCPTFLMKVLN